jgi:hypothetical protein
MPRDGSDIYSIPGGTLATTGTTIESDAYNNFVRDIEADLNEERPIIAGGTGAGSEVEALYNLGGEHASQVVTNYEAHTSCKRAI